MTSSGTYAFNPAISELLIDAFERNGKRGPELTPEWIASGRRSLNLVLVSWSNRGVNLWTVSEFTQYMPQGSPQYVASPSIVDVLPDSVVLRQYQMGAPSIVAPAFTTTLGSAVVTVAGLPATPAAGQYLNVGVMASVGGLILNGFYQVVSVPGSGRATITAASAASSSATGGAVPQIVTSAGNTAMTVNFAGHGLLVGQPFNVEITTVAGGVALLGPYPVASVVNANQFTITAQYPAGSTQTVSENGGLTTLATQATVNGQIQPVDPIDIVLYPLSRGDWMAIPDKAQQGRPTSFWMDRQISPAFNIWPVPDANGPYELRYRASRQIQDADITGGQTLNMPYRFFETFCADLAAHLSMKWAPDRSKDLVDYAMGQWQLASDEDRERVPTFIVPDFGGYFA